MTAVVAVDDAASAAQRVAEHLTGFTYRWATEADLQDAMAGLLADSLFEVEREKRLDRRDRPDFLVTADGRTVAVEVKVKGSRTAVLRQLGRYAEHDSVDAIVFASGLRTLAAAMPAAIHSKPVVSIHLESAL